MIPEFFEKYFLPLLIYVSTKIMNKNLWRIMVLSGSHGQFGYACFPLTGTPTECKALTKCKSRFSFSLFNTVSPIRVIIFMESTT